VISHIQDTNKQGPFDLFSKAIIGVKVNSTRATQKTRRYYAEVSTCNVFLLLPSMLAWPIQH